MEFKIKLQIWTQNEIWNQNLKLEMEPKTEQLNLNIKLKKQIGPEIKSKQFSIIHGLISSPIHHRQSFLWLVQCDSMPCTLHMRPPKILFKTKPKVYGNGLFAGRGGTKLQTKKNLKIFICVVSHRKTEYACIIVSIIIDQVFYIYWEKRKR